jgi:ligand-binding SRPBCC domain-containing protein
VRVHVLHREQLLPHAPDVVFPFFADARNLEAITPPLLRFRVTTPEPITMAAGTLLDYRLRIHGVPVRWRTLIEDWAPPHRFADTQRRGPYARWHHTHTFRPAGDGRTLMTDTVRYAIGFGPLGELAHRLVVRHDLERIFDYRAEAILPLLAQHAETTAAKAGEQARRRERAGGD